MKKVTVEYCRELLDKYELGTNCLDGSDAINTSLLKRILKEASSDSRFRISLDPASDDGEDDTWDLIGPCVPFGRVYYDNKGDAESDRDGLNMLLREHFGPNPRKVQYTPEAHVAKCLLDSPCCPVCGSHKICMEEYKIKGGATCVFARGCEDCNSEWEEVYGLQSYQNVRID